MPARRAPKRTLFILPGLLACGRAFAVAGGGGGGGFDFGSGGDDGIGLLIELVFWILLSLPFPFNLIAIAIVLGIAWLGRKKVVASSGLNTVASPARSVLAVDSIDPAFLHRNPAFNIEGFRSKARTAFLAIQDAWTRQDMKPVRRWISDGVWQRFHTQFAMMRLLEQRNEVSAIEIRKIFFDRIEQDGDFDIIHVGISFTARDDFVSAKFPALDQRGPLELVEFWSFIRRTGVAEKDLYHSALCPSCGAPLPDDLGEVAACRSCGAVSTLGDYDWVLAEITQADDYANRNVRLEKAGALTRRIREALGADRDFSVQHLEDRASNAWMQIVGARVLRQPERLRRFVGDELFGRLSQAIAGDAPVVYNRLYLNSVTLIDHFRRDIGGHPTDHLVVALRLTAQRVDISTGELQQIDYAPYASDEVMVLSRQVQAEPAKGSLYAHSCPSCGGPVSDTLDIKCGYCGNVLNSTRHEWIVTRLMRPDEYRAAASGAKEDARAPEDQVQGLATRVAIDRPDDLAPLFKARDFAFNNVMAVLGADGAITVDELNFAQDLSRRLGYDAKKVAGVVALARQRRLPIRLPEDRKTAAKMLKVMEKAASADNVVTQAERAMLEDVRQRVAAMHGSL
jgi:predicted lipid-binding transport protein (Tim44 family)